MGDFKGCGLCSTCCAGVCGGRRLGVCGSPCPFRLGTGVSGAALSAATISRLCLATGNAKLRLLVFGGRGAAGRVGAVGRRRRRRRASRRGSLAAAGISAASGVGRLWPATGRGQASQGRGDSCLSLCPSLGQRRTRSTFREAYVVRPIVRHPKSGRPQPEYYFVQKPVYPRRRQKVAKV